jgi:hypothetical protein
MKKSTKVMLITFGVFMKEAIMHYNIGKSEVQDETKKDDSLVRFVPPVKSLVKIGGVVLLFSVINSVLIEEAT